MADQRDPTKWIAIAVATLSLTVSGVSAYIQFKPRHDLRAYPIGFTETATMVTINMLAVNRGNQGEAIIGAWARYENGCTAGRSLQAFVPADSAVLVPIRITVPANGFDKSVLNNPGSGVIFDVRIELVDERSNAKHPFLYNRFQHLGEIDVDARVRRPRDQWMIDDDPVDLYSGRDHSDDPHQSATSAVQSYVVSRKLGIDVSVKPYGR